MVYCNKCGTLNPDGSEFCSGCGARMGTVDQPKQPAPQVVLQPAYNGSSSRPKQNKTVIAVAVVMVMVAVAAIAFVGLGNNDSGNDSTEPFSYTATLDLATGNAHAEYDGYVTFKVNKGSCTLQRHYTQLTEEDTSGIHYWPQYLPEPEGTPEPGKKPQCYFLLDKYDYLNSFSYTWGTHTLEKKSGATETVYKFDMNDEGYNILVGSDGIVKQVALKASNGWLLFTADGYKPNTGVCW